jgi:RNA polymerase sigma-70 factor (ECF subfamily)
MLVERFQRGESSAFDEIVDRYRRQVYRLAYRFTHNREDAYDISQEVFIKVFKSLGNLRKASTFHKWLRQIAINTCIDHLRKCPDEKVLDDFSQMEHEHARGGYSELPDIRMAVSELQDMIRKAVDQLPERQRTVFVLRHYEDLSLKDMAQMLKCPLGTVKANLFHATQRLRKLLLPYISRVP